VVEINVNDGCERRGYGSRRKSGNASLPSLAFALVSDQPSFMEVEERVWTVIICKQLQ